MRFIARGARPEDLDDIYNLAHTFDLLNLPPDKKRIAKMIQWSQDSFRGEVEDDKGKYIFVVEDTKHQMTVGCSQIIGKHGTTENPSYSFEVLTTERFSQELGVGFVHRILRMKATTDGPTELGGLILTPNYRGRPEKVGKILSLMRLVYIGMFRKKFKRELYAEMAPPLVDNKRSDFWESLGRKFTGMSYQEANQLSLQDKKFISSLFPSEDIYVCLLNSKARLVIGKVGFETQPAYRLLKRLGFSYNNEVDPFDGGPHIAALCDEIPMIQNGSFYNKIKPISMERSHVLTQKGYFGFVRSGEFYGGYSPYEVDNEELRLPEEVCSTYDLTASDKLYVTAE